MSEKGIIKRETTPSIAQQLSDTAEAKRAISNINHILKNLIASLLVKDFDLDKNFLRLVKDELELKFIKNHGGHRYLLNTDEEYAEIKKFIEKAQNNE